MFHYLQHYAMNNIMCHPEQDHQHKFQLHKLSGVLSVYSAFSLNGRKIRLPDRNKRYHVYNIGNIDPSVLKLIEEYPLWQADLWFNVKDVVNMTTHVAYLYTDKGVLIPTHLCQYMFTNDRGLIVAIEDNSALKAIKLREDKVFIKLYKNAFYGTVNLLSDTLPKHTSTECYSVRVTDSTSRFDAQTKWLEMKSKPTGGVFAFVNGFMVDMIAAQLLSSGDFVTIYRDYSMDKTIDLKVSELVTFSSELDSSYKYILHYPGDSERMDYCDDLELFVYHREGNAPATSRGLIYHTNAKQSIRNLTHKDYSIPVDSVRFFYENLKEFLDNENLALEDIRIRIYVRQSGYNRTEIYNSSRLHDLYKLPDEIVIRALSGLDSNVWFWAASELEKSPFMKLVSSRYDNIDMRAIENGIGYNAISKILGTGLVEAQIKNTKPNIKLKPAHYNYATMYEYNEAGVLVDVTEHVHGSEHYSLRDDVKFIEPIVGLKLPPGALSISNTSIHLNVDEYNFRVYRCTLNNGDPDNFTDITSDTSQWVRNENEFSLTSPSPAMGIMVVTDRYFYRLTKTVTPVNGTYVVHLVATVDVNGVPTEMPLPVPFGELDVFINGKVGIPGIDYVYTHPAITLCSKEHFVTSDYEANEQKIEIRFTGFCDENLRPRCMDDVGYVIHNRLSRNRRYDVRNDRVNKVVLAGRSYPSSILTFDEDSDALPNATSAINGLPYMVRDTHIPYRDYVRNRSSYDMREFAVRMDNAVEDYLTLHLPHKPITETMTIIRRYRLFSPFLNSIIHDLKENIITDEDVNNALSHPQLETLINPYRSLITMEPVFNPLVDERFVIVEPHVYEKPVEISIHKYQFLKRVVDVYLEGKVSLNHHVKYVV